MKITPKSQVKKFQVGGQIQSEAPMDESTPENMPAEQGTEGEPQEGEQDPIMVLAQMAAQALQNQDCQMMAQVCQGYLEIVQQMQGGAPEQPQGEPVFRKGGTLVRRIKK